MSNPSEIVESFIRDYYLWNSLSMEMTINDDVNSMNEASYLYKKMIINVYCKSEFKGESISFGSHSLHESGKEIIIFEKINNHEAVVLTKHIHNDDFVSNYEYRLIKNKNRWYLDAVDYIDDDGTKYPSL